MVKPLDSALLQIRILLITVTACIQYVRSMSIILLRIVEYMNHNVASVFVTLSEESVSDCGCLSYLRQIDYQSDAY